MLPRCQALPLSAVGEKAGSDASDLPATPSPAVGSNRFSARQKDDTFQGEVESFGTEHDLIPDFVARHFSSRVVLRVQLDPREQIWVAVTDLGLQILAEQIARPRQISISVAEVEVVPVNFSGFDARDRLGLVAFESRSEHSFGSTN